MRTSTTLIAAVSALVGSATAESMAVLKQLKIDAWAAQNEAGVYDINRYAAQAATTCVNGKAGEYQCKNVDLVAFLRHQDMGSSTRKGNDIWGVFFPVPGHLIMSEYSNSNEQDGPLPAAVSSAPSARRTAPPSSRSSRTAPSSTSAASPPRPLPRRGAT